MRNAELNHRFLTFRNFPQVLRELLQADPAFAGVTFALGRPKEQAQTPHIWCRRIRRTPGMDRTETRGPRHRDSWERGDGTRTELYSQWMTCTYQFDCCAGSSDEAERMADRLEQFLKHTKGTFLSLGVSEMVFEEELEDHLLPQSADVEVRSVRYLIRFDDVDVRTLPAIQEIQVRVLTLFEEDYEAVTRGADLATYDLLERDYIKQILYVSSASPSGIAREPDYLLGIDYELLVDPISHQTAVLWTQPGKHPDPGDLYYVRYLYWAASNPALLPR